MKNFFNAISKSFKSDPNKTGPDGLNRLQRAILENDYDKVKKLIDAGADYNDRGLLNYPPLHLALLKDRSLIAALLIEQGADVKAHDMLRRTPLHIAAAQGQDYLALKMLEKKADPNAKNAEGRTALHCVSSAKPDLIGLLLRHGADINAQDTSGNAPLHVFMDTPVLAAALLAYGPDVNLKSEYRNSAFRYMLNDDNMMSDRHLLRLMLENNPDMSTCNRDGENIAMCAMRLGLNKDLDFLVMHINRDHRDYAGNNLLHKALHAHNYWGVPLALSHAPQLIEMKNNQGHTPLADYLGRSFEWRFLKSFELFESTVKLLVEHGDNINVKDQNGRTLVHFATKFGQTGLLDFLTKNKADLDMRDRDGKAPIHVLITRKDLDMLDRLLDAGADPDQKDDRGWTILDNLAKDGDRNSPIVQRLIVAGGQYNKQLPLNPHEIKPSNNSPFGKKNFGP